MITDRAAYLINSEVNTSIGNDAQEVWNVALVESLDTLLPQDLLGTIKHP